VRKWLACLLILVLASLAAVAFAQVRGGVGPKRDAPAAEALRAKRGGAARGGERLRRLMSAAGVRVDEAALATPGERVRALRISWETPGRKGSATALREGELSLPVASAVVSERHEQGVLRAPRSLELSPEHVLVATVDAESRLRWWSLVPDPRVIRAEGPKAEGDNELTGVRLFRPRAEFLVHVPGDEEAAEVRFYHPLPEGVEFRLQLLGAVSLRRD
jgi:hypothetical protein